MTFRVGQKVVCVDGRQPQCGVHPVIKGNIYTIRDSGPEPFVSGYWVLLDEIMNHFDPRWGENGYDASRFRPIVENKSTISFTTGADPESERWDNRKKVKERT